MQISRSTPPAHGDRTGSIPFPAAAPARPSPWLRLAVAAWVLVGLGIAGRLLFAADLERNNVYLKVFAPAAEAFAAQRDLYPLADGFRYPPMCAVLLLPFAWCGPLLGSLLWRAVNFAVLLLGVRASFRAGLPCALAPGERALLLVSVAVCGITGLDNGQANALILGCLLWATAGALAGRASAPAAGSTVAAVCKVYPLAFGMVLGVLRPRTLPWLLALVLVAAGLPFLLQPPDYVAGQHLQLFELLWSEDRTQDLANAYRDLRLLTAAVGLPMPGWMFPVLQLLGGAAIALGSLLLHRRVGGVGAFSWACSATLCWFLLLGPATEKATYQFLGVPLAWSWITAARAHHRLRRGLAAAAVVLTLVGLLLPVDRATQGQYPLLRCFLPWATVLVALDLVLQAVRQLRPVAGPAGIPSGPTRSMH